MKLKVLAAVVLALSLSACAPKVQLQTSTDQQNLLQYCTYDTPIPERNGVDANGAPASTGQDFMNALISWQDIYNYCAGMHDKLVDSLMQQKDAEKASKLKSK